MWLVTTKWFPILLALAQLTRHLALIGYDYWLAAEGEKNFDVHRFVAEDFGRPFFQPSGFCGAWISYSSIQTATNGIDFPAYVLTALVFSVASGQAACVDSAMSPRGQVVTAPIVFVVWLLAGGTTRRLALRRWRAPAARRLVRGLLNLAWIPAAFGIFCAVAAIPASIFSGFDHGIQALGLAAWLLFPALLAAERLRSWPFHQINQ